MTSKCTKKVKLLDYLREKKIRKDWLARELSIKLNLNITPVVLSNYLHGRREINSLYPETAIAEILDIPSNELF